MQPIFDRAHDFVAKWEGGFVNHKNDPGGATNMGITRKTLARWRKVTPWTGLPKAAVEGRARPVSAR